MDKTSTNGCQLYLRGMAIFWLPLGLITTFYPQLMDLFQTPEGVKAKTPFSNHVWFHGGLDILSVCTLLLALSRQPVSQNILRSVALAALMPTLAIGYSLMATPYWNPFFILAGLGCLAFVVWGFLLASQDTGSEKTAIPTNAKMPLQ